MGLTKENMPQGSISYNSLDCELWNENEVVLFISLHVMSFYGLRGPDIHLRVFGELLGVFSLV